MSVTSLLRPFITSKPERQHPASATGYMIGGSTAQCLHRLQTNELGHAGIVSETKTCATLMSIGSVAGLAEAQPAGHVEHMSDC